jgi:eukaryotic-like serine/threonine-protein kinase
MALTSGTRLGPYEIESPLGAGGMGEVYRARDTRLDRTVAIKILPSHLSSPEARQRFEREARAISSLNHPHICTLHDIGQQDGTDYLVMEYLEGETLADRLRKGSLPLPQALQYGVQIAEALDKAHRTGVVHRDLKPGNIMLTKSVAKLMDFGLAKGLSVPKATSVELTATLTSSHATPLTQRGTIVGTFQYMAPEQVEGKEADTRSDIFSLGAVLYEMVSGKRAFEGKTAVSVMAAILEKDPEPIKTQTVTPAALERLVKKCLAKDPDARWQNAGDLASELKWVADGGATSSTEASLTTTAPTKHSRLPWAIAAVCALAAIALAVVHFAFRQSQPVIRTQIAPSEKLQFNFVGDGGGPPVISPDGTQIVFSAKSEGKTQLYVRSLEKLTPQPLLDTLNATWPFWSPDGRYVGFFTDKLKRIDVAGGPAAAICDATSGRGGAWNKDGTIVFSPFPTGPLFRVQATGGTPVAVTKLTGNYSTHRFPQFMPDGQHFIYFAANHSSPSSPDDAVFWASLDGNENKLVVHTLFSAIYSSGYLLYARDNTLLAQRFDPSTGELNGDAAVLNDDVQSDATVWRATFSASENGTLIYQPGSGVAGLHLTWMDRTGKEIENVFEPDLYDQVELSRDGKKAAVTIGNPMGVIWIYDLEHNTKTRFTFGESTFNSPVWSPDGKQIAYLASEPGGVATARFDIMVKASDGSGEAKTLLASVDAVIAPTQQGLWDWSPDGKYLLFTKGTPFVGEGWHIWALPLSGGGKPFAYAAAAGDQWLAQFSPDGHWITYTSTEGGRPDIYVAPFPWTGAKWQLSTNGNFSPRWSRGGKEIIFEAVGSSNVYGAQVNIHGSSLAVGEIQTLFAANDLSPDIAAHQFDVTHEGQRLLQITTGDAGKLPLTVIQNWTAELKKK